LERLRRGLLAQFRQAEVQNLHASLAAGQHDVGGLEVALDDSLLVAGCERIGEGVSRFSKNFGLRPRFWMTDRA
jgi:hypothetical protein